MLHDWRIEPREYERQEARRGRRHAFEMLEPHRTALVVVGRVLGARGGLAHNGAQAESYERSKLYDPSFATGYRKASS